LAGIPPLSGFFSEGQILGHAFGRTAGLDRYLFLWIAGLFAAALSALYTFRPLFEVFFGMSRVPVEVEGHIHELPTTITVSLTILMFFALVCGWLALPVLWGERSPLQAFLEPSLRGAVAETERIVFAHHGMPVELALMAGSLAFAALGLGLAY